LNFCVADFEESITDLKGFHNFPWFFQLKAGCISVGQDASFPDLPIVRNKYKNSKNASKSLYVLEESDPEYYLK
jgi:hypothetical protein